MPSPVSVSNQPATATSRSGTITAGGTAQTLMAANASRQGFSVQNLSTENLYINELGSAAVNTQPSILVPPNALYEPPLGCVSVAAISILGATTGSAFTAREW